MDVELVDPKGKKHVVSLRRDKKAEGIRNYLQAGLSYLASRGVIRHYENPETGILVGHLPTRAGTRRNPIYVAFREKIGNDDYVVLDDRLDKDQEVAWVMHELVHGLYPESSEHEVQVTSAKCLKRLARDHSLLSLPQNAPAFKDHYADQDTLSEHDLENAYDFLIEGGVYGLQESDVSEPEAKKRSKRSDLEEMLGFTAIFSFLISMFSYANITGNVVSHVSNFQGTFFITFAILSSIAYFLIKKK